ncbi:MAG: SCO family protein [Chloroflexi bacterium]|nr:SCO family protein [Chloroflexota bacterium]
MSVGILGGLVLAYAFFLLGKALRPPLVLRGAQLNPPRPAVGFTLTGPGGQDYSLRDFRGGKIVLLYFGYTTSPDLCPRMLAKLAEARAALGTDATRVQVIFVTIDPERDTPEITAEYAWRFGQSFLGLSGAAADIRTLANSYGVFYAYVAGDDQAYQVEHTPLAALIDMQGQLRAVYPLDMAVEDISVDLRILLEE